MIRTMHHQRAAALLVASLSAYASAQTYEIVTSTIDGGGGTVSAGGYSISYTIGQPDAQRVSAGGYTLAGGFWPVAAQAQPDCLGDLTSTGATLPGQPGFGTPDGVANIDDLGYYLNLWLVSDPEADFTTTGATLDGQPGFGSPDGQVNLDDLGYFLNFWLQGCG